MRQVRLQSSGQWVNVLGKPLGRFAYTNAYSLLENEQTHARLYRSRAVASVMQKTIAAMQQQPPPFVANKQDNSTLLAANWPMDLLYDKDDRFCGYCVPAIKEKNAYRLDIVFHGHSLWQKIGSRDYRSRVLIAYNLAAMLASLHMHEVTLFGFSPARLALNLPDLRIGVTDCENYNIVGITDSSTLSLKTEPYYTYRDSKNMNSGRAQNNFALAVIIFRLMNRGIFPYQCMSARWPGIKVRMGSAMRLRIYTYQDSDPRGLPLRGSIHRYFDAKTTEMFALAFQSPEQAPSALEWQLHLRPFIIENSEQLKQCDQNLAHAYFNKGCGLCAQTVYHPRDFNVRSSLRVNLYSVIDRLFQVNLSERYWRK